MSKSAAGTANNRDAAAVDKAPLHRSATPSSYLLVKRSRTTTATINRMLEKLAAIVA